MILSMLAGVYGEVGRFAAAASAARHALAVTPPADTGSVETLKTRIAQYEARGSSRLHPVPINPPFEPFELPPL